MSFTGEDCRHAADPHPMPRASFTYPVNEDKENGHAAHVESLCVPFWANLSVVIINTDSDCPAPNSTEYHSTQTNDSYMPVQDTSF